MSKLKKKIESIKVKAVDDDINDISYLGKFSSKVPDKYDLNRGNAFFRPNAERGEHKYFIPANKVETTREFLQSRGYARSVAEEKAREDNKRDFARAEKIASGDIQFVGIVAKAEILVPLGDHWISQQVRSGGLWGIESDSGEEYFEEVGKEQVAELKEILLEYGFTKTQLQKVKVVFAFD